MFFTERFVVKKRSCFRASVLCSACSAAAMTTPRYGSVALTFPLASPSSQLHSQARYDKLIRNHVLRPGRILYPSAARLTEAVKTQQPFAYRFRKRRCGNCSYVAVTASARQRSKKRGVAESRSYFTGDRCHRYGKYPSRFTGSEETTQPVQLQGKNKATFIWSRSAGFPQSVKSRTASPGL